MDNMPRWAKFNATKVAPIDKVRKILPLVDFDSSKCECVIQIGLFFDGTGNNEIKDVEFYSHSNIVRLSNIYSTVRNCFRVYIPGLGTPFPHIGEKEEKVFGAAFGSGGDKRIWFSLLMICNALSKVLKNDESFDKYDIEALCSEGRVSKREANLLAKYGIAQRLVGLDHKERIKFFKNFLETMKESVSNEKCPKILEVLVDVFGFSRGAAEARVFCHWLKELTENSKIIDIPLRFRFLGLMDTVASVGVIDGINNTINGDTGGHGEWAKAENLHILPEVENCVHFVSMHEQRRNFPLDTVAIGDTQIPPNCIEYVYPGTHSDVGGGYRPGELGISGGDSLAKGDRKKLSQIPLNHMYQCAIAAGVPLLDLPQNLSEGEYNAFAICPDMINDFNKFLELSNPGPKLLSEWLLPYLVWRWQNSKKYQDLKHVTKATDKEKKFLIDGNADFLKDAGRIKFFGDEIASDHYVNAARENNNFNANSNYGDYRQKDLSYLAPESVKIHQRVISEIKEIQMPPEISYFFDTYVHDSVAGFRDKLVENTGHWKYRRLFRGYYAPRLSDVDYKNNNEKV